MNSPITLPNPKVTISPVGMQVTGELTFDEWKELAASIGQAARSIAFIMGDWLVYGQNLFGTDGFPDKRVDPVSYQLAMAVHRPGHLHAPELRLRQPQRALFVAHRTALLGTPPDPGQAARGRRGRMDRRLRGRGKGRTPDVHPPVAQVA